MIEKPPVPLPATAPVGVGLLSPAEKSGGVRAFIEQAKRHCSSGRAGIAIREGSWSLGSYAATQLLRTFSTILLARHFLGPEAFGTLGLVTVFLAGLGMFSELGVVASIVQHPRGNDPRFLSTALSIQAGRGFLIWLAAVVASYPLARFYNQPEILPLLVVAALSEVIRGLSSTRAWTLTRQMKLRSLSLLTVASEIVALGVCMLWAITSPSAWALVARTIASAAVFSVGTHFIAKPIVRFGWDWSGAKDILHFGGWISISTAAYFLGGQGERLILGKFISPAELGCFSLATMISSVPAAGVGQLVNQLFLPMISTAVRTSRPDTIRDFLQARRFFFGVALLSGIGFLVCANPLIGLLLTPKYAMTGWMLQALGLRVALDLFAAPASSMILAYGKSKYAAAANTSRVIFVIGGVWTAFVLFGLREAIVSLLVAQVLSYFPLIIGLGRLLPEVALAELRWYGALLALLTLGAIVSWRGI